MAKPKFTPDPVPDGMDPQLAEYLSRQLNRIEDWWPKDYEERIQALEQLAPYCTGTWPIVDYSNITFESVAEVVQVAESVLSLYSLAAVAISESDYDNFGSFGAGIGASIAAVDSSADGTIVAVDLDELLISNDAVSWSTVTAATLGHQSGSSIKRAAYSDGKWVIICVPTGGNGFRVLHTTDFVSFDLMYETTDIVSTGIHTADTDGEGNFVLSGYDTGTGITTAWYSNDNGETWAESAGLPFATSSSRRGQNAFYENGLWFILGNKEAIWSSPDRINWTLRYAPESASQFQFSTCLRYGDGLYVCVQNGPAGSALLTSTDGFNWTDQGAFNNSNATSLFFHPTHKWAFASGNSLQKSSDGINWSAVSGTWGSLIGIAEISRQV